MPRPAQPEPLKADPLKADPIDAACRALEEAGWVRVKLVAPVYPQFELTDHRAIIRKAATSFFRDAVFLVQHRTTATASISRTARRLARENKT